MTPEECGALRTAVALEAMRNFGVDTKVAEAAADTFVLLCGISADDVAKVGASARAVVSSTSADVCGFAKDFGISDAIAQRAAAAGFTGAVLSGLVKEHLRDRRTDTVAAFVETRVWQAEMRKQIARVKQ